jgi:uncharacterized protein (TIGR00369 family)
MAASPRDASDARALPGDYPPAEHVLRDLRLWSDSGAEPPCAGLPVAAQIHGAAGTCSAGALAVLVDVVAGGAALRSAEGGKGQPRAGDLRAGPAQQARGERSRGWIATSDLRVHWLRPVAAGELVARAEPLRSGRSSSVIEVEVEAAGAVVAHGTVGFSRLEAKGEYQTRAREPRVARVEWGGGRRGFVRPWAERLGVAVRDASAGVLELPVTPYVGNSLGGLQGGIAVALLDLAAEAAGCARLGRAAATRDLSVHFLAIGRRGPLRTSARVLRADGDALLLRLEARDAGAEDRLCTIATATVATW